MVGAGLSPEQGLETLRARLPYLVEEIGEHSKALNNDDLDDALPELADVAFVAAGSVLTMGRSGPRRLPRGGGQERRQDARHTLPGGVVRQGAPHPGGPAARHGDARP